jgi:CBS domain-containing protein
MPRLHFFALFLAYFHYIQEDDNFHEVEALERGRKQPPRCTSARPSMRARNSIKINLNRTLLEWGDVQDVTISVGVKDVMERNVPKVEASTTASQAVEKMVEGGFWSLLVEKNGIPVGVVTDRDILKRVIAKGNDIKRVRLEEIMTSPIITVSPTDTMDRAMKIMVEKQIRRIYVAENGKIVGRITQTSLFASTFDVMRSLSGLTQQF